MKAFEEQYGVQIVQAWGMTETSPLATVARPLPGVPTTSSTGRCASTQGRPVCGVEARIVDDDGNPLPHDGKAVGEVQVRGPWITGSYYRNRDESKFDDGWLHTGDVGRIDPLGYVTLTDRAKDVIKSGGEWISSVELENHLMGHPAVIEAAVVAVPDERWQERPLAVVVVNEGAEVVREGAAGVPGRQGRSLVAARAVGVHRPGAAAPASASSTRRPSGRATPRTPTTSSSSATDFPGVQTAHTAGSASSGRPGAVSMQSQRSARW